MKQNILNRMFKALSEVSNSVETEEATSAEVSLASATIEGQSIEAEEFEVGQAVFAVSEEGERMPLPEGEYMTDEGNAFAVDAEGVISRIGAMEEEVVEEEEAELKQEAPVAKKVVESNTVSKETFFEAIEKLEAKLSAALEAKDKEIETLKTELSAVPSESATKVAPISEPKPIKNQRAKGVGKTTQDRVMSRMFGSN